MTIAYLSHPECLLHDMGPGHPESPARLRAIERAIADSGLEPSLRRYESPPVDAELLKQVHDPDYVDRLVGSAPRHGTLVLDPDTSMNPHSLPAALHAAGAGIQAVDLVLAGSHKAAFCAVRPPGHHAERSRAMGFCFFDNVAVAAGYALEHCGLKRVAILDFDVHHGNGTEDIVANDERILFCSTFQHPFYPGGGADTRSDHIVNCPLAAGSGSREFRAAITDQWLPAVTEHRPELIFISAGFDAHREDFLAGLELTDGDYDWVTGEIAAWAATYCDGRIVSFLEGGYALDALGRSVVAHLGALPMT